MRGGLRDCEGIGVNSAPPQSRTTHEGVYTLLRSLRQAEDDVQQTCISVYNCNS